MSSAIKSLLHICTEFLLKWGVSSSSSCTMVWYVSLRSPIALTLAEARPLTCTARAVLDIGSARQRLRPLLCGKLLGIRAALDGKFRWPNLRKIPLKRWVRRARIRLDVDLLSILNITWIVTVCRRTLTINTYRVSLASFVDIFVSISVFFAVEVMTWLKLFAVWVAILGWTTYWCMRLSVDILKEFVN